MVHISKPLDTVMTDIFVTAMLDSKSDLYIGTLTLDRVQSLFAEMDNPSTNIVSLFWKAFHTAQAKYEEQEQERAFKKELEEILTFNPLACPECGCSEHLGYTPGVPCPNCDYIEE